MRSTFNPRHGNALHKALNGAERLSGAQKLEAELEMVELECARRLRAVDSLQMLSSAERTSLKFTAEVHRVKDIEAIERGEFAHCRKARW